MIKILFFGALRERVQCASLKVLAAELQSVAAVLQHLKTHSALFQQAFSDNNLLCAVNQQLCDLQTPVKAGDEVAFFPPVTGG